MSGGLPTLEAELRAELHLLRYPADPWLLPAAPGIYDVVIIGAGMAGLAAAAALKGEGIVNFQILDANPIGHEGPWGTYARMRTLRSHKSLVGPALAIPKLTFEAWYTAQHGQAGWEQLYKIPTRLWMEYLNWYRRVLDLPVRNQCTVTSLRPVAEGIALVVAGQKEEIIARKVVLATGRLGFGGMRVPVYIQQLPRKYYAHTCEFIDFQLWRGKHICILGAGASGFDAAASALEAGAKAVTMLVRRPLIPSINKFASVIYPGFSQGFLQLPDQAKIDIMQHASTNGGPPPFESLDRVKQHPHFQVLTHVEVSGLTVAEEAFSLLTNAGVQTYDFLILATGFVIDGRRQPELHAIIDAISLWGERYPALTTKLAAYPYLGPHFEFTEKTPGTAPYLRDIYCYNYAATLSHGLTSSDIPDISVGAMRLAKGIVSDFFTQHWQDYFAHLQQYVKPEFLATDYPFIQPGAM